MAVMFAGSLAFAGSYTITFKDSGGTSDSSTKQTTVAGIVATNADSISAVTVNNVYQARQGRGIKLGTSKVAGELVLTLNTPVKATSLVVNAMRYKDGEATLKIQDKSDYTLTATADDYTYTYSEATEISTITLASVTLRNYLISLTVNYEDAAAPEPEPTTQDLYLKLSSDWAGWPAKYAVYYFNDTENGWSEFMTEVDGEDNTYTTTIPVGYSKVIFVRLDGEATEANWDNKWSQTGDEDIPEGKNHFTVTSGGTGSECGGVWAKYPVVPTYYVKGSFNNWGDGMEMTEGSYTFEDLAADTYEIKVVDDANNWYGFEVLDQTKSSANIYNAGGNIKFTLAEAGNVTVAYANSKITVTGTFVAPTTKFTVTVPEGTEKAYIAGNFNNWTPTEMTLKAGEEDVFELTVEGVESDTVAYKYLAGADWKFEEVIENNRSYNAADEVSAWKAVPTIYKYAKVKEAPVNWTGHYIIAWADLKPHSVISGKDFIADAATVAFTDGDTISIMEGNDFAVEIRFSEEAGKYTVKLPNGKYLAIPGENAMSEQDAAFAFTMGYDAVNKNGVQFGNGDLTVTTNRIMYQNNTNYRSYTNKLTTNNYNLPTLYRLVNEPFDCLDGPYGVLINGRDVVVAEALAGEEEYDAAGRKQYRAYLNLEKEDIIQIVNTSCGSAWLPAIEEGGMSAHFDADDEMAVIDTTGCFDLYIKMKSGDDKIYIGAGICADDTIRYTVRGKGGILGEDFEKAIDSKQDTLELALEAGKYELKVIVGADWKGFEQLTDTATGLKVGDQGNICFELNEAGAVSIVYNDSVFKLIGNFYVAPIKYYIAGSMTDWAEHMVELLPLEEKADSLGIAINLEADSLYAFKVVRVQGTDTAWYGMGGEGTMTYGNSTGWYVYKSENDQNQANVGLMTTKAAEYPFVVKVADDHMEVSVAIPVRYYAKYNVGEDWAWSMMTEKEGKWIADSVVYRGGGANVYFAEDNDHAWYFNESGEEAFKKLNAYEGLAVSDTVQFIFNPADTTLAVALLGKYIAPDPTVAVRGSMNDWGDEIPFVLSDDKTYASLTVENISADTYEFKFIINGEYRSNGYRFHRGFPGVAGISGNEDADMTFEADQDGEYTIQWYFANDSLAIIFPEYIEPAKEYYAKYAEEWAWKKLTEKEGLWLTDTIVYQGIGININDQAADENNMFYSNTVEEEGVRPIAGAEIDVNDTIYFSFNPADSVVTAIMVGKYVPQLPVVGFGANFNGWNWLENLFVPAEDNLSASFKITLGVTDTIEFKIVSDGNWLSLYGEGDSKYLIHRDWNHADHVNATGEVPNLAFNADAEGEYIFTWTYADSTLVVTFPAAPVDPTEHTYTVAGNLADAFGTAWDPTNAANDMVKQEDGTYKWEKAELTLAAGTVQFKVCEDHAWDVAYPASDYKLNIAEQGEYTITITFNLETKAVDAVATKTGDAEVTVNYYLVGSVKGWEAKAENIFTLNAEAGEEIEEYVIETTLAVGEGLKVVSSTGAWYPEGMGNEYVVDKNHAGATTIYFRPAYNEEWAAFGGYMYVVPTDPTALDEIMAAGKAVKIVRNGQILIIKGEKIFNAQGQLVK